MAALNRQWRLASRPTGDVKDENFERAEGPVPEPGDGEILVRNLYLSMDPTQRGWMARDTYLPAVKIGEVMRSFAAGRVERSRHANYAPGDLVSGLFGWQDYAVVRGEGASAPAKVPAGVPLTGAMSAFGPTGLTAYFGLLDIGRPAAGETVLVSGAAGATGMIAGQIAKIKGCRAIGVAGGRDKCEWLVREAGFDAAIDYKNESVPARLAELCPKGVDVYFDNVGGETLDHALARLAMRGRVVLCGAISGYSSDETPPGPKNYLNLISRRGTMRGFIVLDYMGRAGEALADLSAWAAAGKLVDRVDVQEGFDNAPATLRRLFAGKNQGKQLLKIAD